MRSKEDHDHLKATGKLTGSMRFSLRADVHEGEWAGYGYYLFARWEQFDSDMDSYKRVHSVIPASEVLKNVNKELEVLSKIAMTAKGYI